MAAPTAAPPAWAQEAGQKFEITSSLTELYGAEKAERFREILDPDDRINWQVYRPAHNGDKPHGVLVYVSPTRSGDMDQVLNNRYVFVSGTRDFNLNETRIVYRKYLKAGAQNSLLEIENGMSHALPNANTLATALEFLDRK